MSGCGPKPEWVGSSQHIRSRGDSGPTGDVVGRSAHDPQRKWTRTSAIRLFRFSPQSLPPIRAFPGSNSRKTYQWEHVGPRIR